MPSPTKNSNWKRTLTATALSAALAAAASTATGCATVSATGELTRSGRKAVRRGLFLQKIGLAKPVILEGATLAEENPNAPNGQTVKPPNGQTENGPTENESGAAHEPQ